MPGDVIRTLAPSPSPGSLRRLSCRCLLRAVRIEQLLHVDLSRPDQRLALHLAARAVILARPAE